MVDDISSDQCMPPMESKKRKGTSKSKQLTAQNATMLIQQQAETEMHGDSQRLRTNVTPPASSAEILQGAGQSSTPKGASPSRANCRPRPQISTVSSSSKDVLKNAIWNILPSVYPGLSATEVHDRLRKQPQKMLEHQFNLKGFQSAVYTALNEMTPVYVDRRRLKGARNQYIALQRTQGDKAQGKECTNFPESPAPMEDKVLHAQLPTVLEPQETKRSPGCRLVETQTAPERTVPPQPLTDGLSKRQTAIATETCQDPNTSYASAEQAPLRGSTEETRNDVVHTQSQSLAVSLNKRHDDENPPSTPAIAPSTNTDNRPENTDTMRHRTASDSCPAETPSNTLVAGSPTVSLSNNGLLQKTRRPASSPSVEDQGEQPKAARRVMQQNSNQDSLVTKSSKTVGALCREGSKILEGCKAQSHVQGELLGRVTASPLPTGIPAQQKKASDDGVRVDEDHTAQVSCSVQTDNTEDVDSEVLMNLGKRVRQAHKLRFQCETYKRKKMGLQAISQAKQAALTESINRANADIAYFNKLNSRHQNLQAQLSDSERKLADARHQTTLSRDAARHEDMEYQTHTASIAELTDEYASADRDYQNELRSLGFGDDMALSSS